MAGLPRPRVPAGGAQPVDVAGEAPNPVGGSPASAEQNPSQAQSGTPQAPSSQSLTSMAKMGAGQAQPGGQAPIDYMQPQKGLRFDFGKMFDQMDAMTGQHKKKPGLDPEQP